MTITVGSLCTGYGGLELATATMWDDLETRWVSEIDPAAMTVLERRWPGVPNVGDITRVGDVEQVDVITAGFPCQPMSTAGKGLGFSDHRWIWPHIARVLDLAEPRVVLLENVPGLLTVNGGAAWSEVQSDLTRRGYEIRWKILSAAEIGACHRRRRVFIVAQRAELPAVEGALSRVGGDLEVMLPTPSAFESQPSDEFIDEMRAAGVRPDARLYLPGRRWHSQRTLARIVPLLPTPTEADSRSSRRATLRTDERKSNPGVTLNDVAHGEWWGDYAEAIARHTDTFRRDAPHPQRENRRVSSAFVEWMMMLPRGWVVGTGLSWPQRLRVLGNGVVPAQAAVAFTEILEGRADPDQLALEVRDGT